MRQYRLIEPNCARSIQIVVNVFPCLVWRPSYCGGCVLCIQGTLPGGMLPGGKLPGGMLHCPGTICGCGGAYPVG